MRNLTLRGVNNQIILVNWRQLIIEKYRNTFPFIPNTFTLTMTMTAQPEHQASKEDGIKTIPL